MATNLPRHSLLSSGNFSDVEIICGDRVWKCHRAILATRSVWFRKALSGPFEVRQEPSVVVLVKADHRNAQEASSRRVNLEEKDPIFIDLALKHIYGNGERHVPITSIT